MPYIPQYARAEIDGGAVPTSPGELNYALTKVVTKYLESHGPQPGYSVLSEAVAALECAKLELYRRVVAPYEDVKARQNGDVYG